MSKFLSCVLIIPIACSTGHTSYNENIGTLEEPIYLPAIMGLEGDGYRCDTDWAGGKCQVPDSRTAKIYVIEASCPGNWWKQRIQNAIIDMNTLVAPYGWSIQQVGINDPFMYTIGCETAATGPTAYSWFAESQDCHDTSRGELCQTRGGFILIRPNYAEQKGVFIAATDFQRRAYAANAIRHEIGHMTLGFGHLPGTQEGKKLMAKGYPDDLQSLVWNSFLGPDEDELRALDCYSPGSGTGDSC